MPDFRRYYQPNAWVFITCVTHQRIPYLRDPEILNLLWDVIHRTQSLYSFDLPGYVFMPDHFHWLMHLENGEQNFSRILKSIKWWSTVRYKQTKSITGTFHLWQPRFWDHMIRDEDDFERHLDYIHWNPVKHGLKDKPEAWCETSYLRWLDQGFYDLGWGWSGMPPHICKMDLD